MAEENRPGTDICPNTYIHSVYKFCLIMRPNDLSNFENCECGRCGMSSGGAAEEPEVEEASLQLTIPAVSRLEDVAFSKVVQLKGHQW